MIRLALPIAGQIGLEHGLSESDRHYLFDVMRQKPGAFVEVITEDGALYVAVLLKGGSLRLTAVSPSGWTPKRPVTLYQALLKGDHFSEAVDRAVQAGVDGIVPLVTERSIVREASANRRARWQAIAKEASEQSGRATVPHVQRPMPLASVRVDPAKTEAYVLHPEGETDKVWLAPSTKPLALAVGPEGGFSPAEVHGLVARGFQPLSLGPAVYRAENAGAFAAVLFLQ